VTSLYCDDDLLIFNVPQLNRSCALCPDKEPVAQEGDIIFQAKSVFSRAIFKKKFYMQLHTGWPEQFSPFAPASKGLEQKTGRKIT
jgi:hypothetical protein